MNDEIGVGIIGLGFMGRTHAAAYRKLADQGVRLRGVADARLTEARGVERLAAEGSPGPDFNPDGLRLEADAASLFDDPAIQLISICTPTDTHVDLAIAALEAGKNVLVEKPVALTSAEVSRLCDAAAQSDRLCVPAMCIRFWPAWAWLHEKIQSGEFGTARTATFRRIGGPPSWSRAFYSDPGRSGGALMDLHIHDVDFIRFCFGDPSALHSIGHRNHVISSYRFAEDGPIAVAEGGWILGMEFSMSFLVCFDEATVDYCSGRDPELILHTPQESETLRVDEKDGYDHQLAHTIACLRGEAEPRVTLADALAVTSLLEQEAEALQG